MFPDSFPKTKKKKGKKEEESITYAGGQHYNITELAW